MILRSAPSGQPDDWQKALKQLMTTPSSLNPFLTLSESDQQRMAQAGAAFPLRIPRDYLEYLAGKDPQSPALKQFIPDPRELLHQEGFSTDPVQEHDKNPVPGLLHKYQGRVLLILSSACPVHCRYCFRRHFPYNTNRNNMDDWQRALNYIRHDNSLTEVIFSGGDPLSLQDWQLAEWFGHLDRIPHIKRLRFHTRYPLVLPQRLTKDLLTLLHHSRLPITVVIHCNHPDELSPQARDALLRLKDIPTVTLLNQSVLLKGVNDQVETLVTLSENLHESGVLPYYLHLLDPVQGAAHFDIPEAQALALHRALQQHLPGYLVPKLVREAPGQLSKTVLG